MKMFSHGLAKGALAALLAGGQLAAAHMEIQFPAPFRSKFNPNAVEIDYTNTAPLDPSGANYPCKGYHVDLGTPAGKPTATFAPGGSYNFTVVGGAPHGGGSCQVSLSYDKGQSFTVIQSIIGGCPLSSSYDFTIPADAPEGEAIWAWTWSNNIGNREHYMNCAPVTIAGNGGGNRGASTSSVPFSQRPAPFTANIGNGCSTVEGTDVDYPDPGPDVINNGGNLGQPVGNCGPSGPKPNPGSGNGGDNGSGNGNGGDAPGQSTEAPAIPSPTVSVPVSASASLPGYVPESPRSSPIRLTAITPIPSSGPITSSCLPSPSSSGVFITAPAEQSSAPPAAEQPTQTTLATQTTSAPAVKPPAATGGAGSGSGSGTGTGNGSGSGNATGGYAPGTPCTTEGAWNCIGGGSFQRCASGTWSAVMQMAAGTACEAGEAQALTLATRMRLRRSAKLRLA